MGAKFNGFLFICVLVAVLYFFDNVSHDIVNKEQQISLQGKEISSLWLQWMMKYQLLKSTVNQKSITVHKTHPFVAKRIFHESILSPDSHPGAFQVFCVTNILS